MTSLTNDEWQTELDRWELDRWELDRGELDRRKAETGEKNKIEPAGKQKNNRPEKKTRFFVVFFYPEAGASWKL